MEHTLEGYTALITGASTGLGKNMVIECVQRGMNIIAVALPGPELESLKSLITHNYPAVRVETIGADLTTDEGCKHVYESARAYHMKIKVLINCAGANLTMPFEKIPPERASTVIRLNALGTTLMTRYFIEDLMEHQPSYILSVSSLGSLFHLPHKQVYGASKAYIYSFSRNLKAELLGTDVNVSVLCPGGLSSNLRSVLANAQTNWMGRQSITSPEFVARVAVRGMFKGKEVIIPGKMNKFFLFLDKLMPASLKAMLLTSQMKKLSESK